MKVRVNFHIVLKQLLTLPKAADELEWYIPAAILPGDLQRSLNIINQFLEKPLDLEGKKASQLISKKRRRRRRRRSPSPDANGESSEDEVPKKKKEKKKKEKQQYKSAQFIEDSDAELADMEAFLEKEKALREKTAKAAAETGRIATMKPTGTKKRRKKAGDNGTAKKRRKRGGNAEVTEAEKNQSDGNDSDESELNIFGSPPRSPSTAQTSPEIEQEQVKPRPRPRPRPLAKPSASDEAHEGTQDVVKPLSLTSLSPLDEASDRDSDDLHHATMSRKKGRLQLVLSDEEDD